MFTYKVHCKDLRAVFIIYVKKYMSSRVFSDKNRFWHGSNPIGEHGITHGLRTPNEGINQRNLKIWADLADEICMLWSYLKIWEWELIFGHAVKAISSPGVRSP